MSILDIYSTIRVQVIDGVATVTLHRPEVRNAIDAAMIRELTGAFGVLNARRDISAIVLRGEGKSFCAGADLHYMQSQANFTEEQNITDAEQLFEMFWTLRSCPHPVIGRLHGHVMGGALGLAAICDIAAAVDGTRFCFSEARLGLAPAVISPFVLERMRASHARRYMVTAETFAAPEALAADLLHFVGDESAVDGFIGRILEDLAKNGPDGMRATKGLLRAVSERTDWQSRRELTTKVIAERRVSAEGQEGLRSFFEKRDPSWRKSEGPKS